MIETLLGGALGGVLRLAPEIIKSLDRRNERRHELAMFDRQIEADKLRAAQQLQLAQENNAAAEHLAGMAALQQAIESQAQPSGIRWVDAASAFVRPGITYAYFGVYLAVRVSAFVHGGSSLESLAQVWNSEDSAMLAAILNFWFLGRVFERRR